MTATNCVQFYLFIFFFLGEDPPTSHGEIYTALFSSISVLISQTFLYLPGKQYT